MADELVYGRNPVRELVAAGARPVREVWALPSVAGEPWLSGVRVVERSRAEIGRRAGTSDHQGVVALTEPYPYRSAAEVLDRVGPVVCLDGAQDPRNLGAIARVAEGLGAAGLVIPRRGGPGVGAVVAKASAGAVEHLPIARVDSVAAVVHDARGAGRTAVGADAERGEDHRALDWPPDVVLVLGAEGEGLRPRVRSACDRLVRVRMRGRVGSLNIAVAAGILVAEALRNVN